MDRDNYRNNNRSDKDDKSGYDKPDNEWEQLSYKLGNDITRLEDENNFFEEVNSSLAKQISVEMEGNNTAVNRKAKKKKRRFKRGVKIFAVIFSVIMILFGFLIFTKPGNKLILNMAGKYIYGNLDYKPNQAKPVISDNNIDSTSDEQVKPKQDIVNILLIGVEEIGGASNTDSMIIASMNTKDKTLKLTSLMRDSYVSIEGYDNNKLNSVYSKGGIELLYDTIEKNFGVILDGYALVNFEAFEQIVDLVGGVEITLTGKEAAYLNSTNYISKPEYRDVVEGTQTVNGNQAVGYCRVRYVSTGTESNDFGRTQRQRAVLNSIFQKVRSKNILQLGLLMNSILKSVNIETDITQTEFNSYLEEAVSLNVKELQNLRIPTDDGYENARVKLGSYNQEVLQIKDWDATRELIRKFIYGEPAGSTADESVDSSNDETTEE